MLIRKKLAGNEERRARSDEGNTEKEGEENRNSESEMGVLASRCARCCSSLRASPSSPFSSSFFSSSPPFI